MWSPMPLPRHLLPERLIGFSLPISGQVAIVSDEGIHLLDLKEPSSIHHEMEYQEGGRLYDTQAGTLAFKGRTCRILGLHGGAVMTKSPQGERLHLDLKKEVLEIRGKDGEMVFQLNFEDLSGDWGHATFTEDGSLVLLGLPYDLHVLRRS